MPQNSSSPIIPADAAASWVDYMPVWLAVWLRLMRFDRPIGIWLLFWPCLWGLAAAAESWPDWRLVTLFAFGAALMRAAGCVQNDIADRAFDAQTLRGRGRPLASGAISVRGALALLAILLLAAAAVLLSLNQTALYCGLAILPLVSLYPYMKRVTHWPQFFLGLTFGYGAVLGWAAQADALAPAAFLLYGAAICWTIGYDTIYGLQDKEEDAGLGLGSTALLVKEAHIPFFVALFYALAVIFLIGAGLLLGASGLYYGVLAAAAGHFCWQIARLDPASPAACLKIFRSGREAGGLIALALLAG